jgi:hypothetical protein
MSHQVGRHGPDALPALPSSIQVMSLPVADKIRRPSEALGSTVSLGA